MRYLSFFAILAVAVAVSSMVLKQYAAYRYYEKSRERGIGNEEKKKYLQSAMLIEPENAVYYDDLGLAYLKEAGKSVQGKKELHRLAWDYFSKAIARDRANQRYQYHLSVAKYRMDGNKVKFVEAMEKTEKLYPANKRVTEIKERFQAFMKK